MKKKVGIIITEDNPQNGESIKDNLPIKNNMTDHTKNVASQTPGLNQASITKDDLFPSDGDNMTI